MRLRKGSTTARERIFIDHYAGTHDPTYAATKAGYAHPEQRGYEMIKKDRIMEAVNARLRAKLEKLVEEVPDLYAKIMRSDRSKDADRLKAASLIQASHHAFNPIGGSDAQNLENQTLEQIQRDKEDAERRYEAALFLASNKAKLVEAIEVETPAKPDIMG